MLTLATLPLFVTLLICISFPETGAGTRSRQRNHTAVPKIVAATIAIAAQTERDLLLGRDARKAALSAARLLSVVPPFPLEPAALPPFTGTTGKMKRYPRRCN